MEREPTISNFHVGHHARLGNLRMVRYRLDAGASIHGSYVLWGNPLVAACRWGHEDIVDFLLSRGTDPDYKGEKLSVFPTLFIVAKAGNFAIVRKLVESGAKVGFEEAFFSAVQLKYTVMVRYLLDFGRKMGFDVKEGGCLISREAKSSGLESMVELLQEEGII